MNRKEAERGRRLLCELGDAIRERVIAARAQGLADTFAGVAGETTADTIYAVDKISEEAILDWFDAHWPVKWPVELVMEGVEEADSLTFPRGTPLEQVLVTCILDPIDGTRGLMYDKRSAWALAALAPREKGRPRLSDIRVAAMTEIPTSKQTVTDQISGVSCCGPSGIIAERRDSPARTRVPLPLNHSCATDFRHGFASFCKFFPEGRSLTAKVEEELWSELHHLGATASPVIFDDQYISTGGQIYELLTGHDRLIADIRPNVLAKAGFPSSLVCHPYDICTGMLLVEAGCVLEKPDGSPVDAPLDTTSPISWIGYANPTLASLARPILQRLLKKHLAEPALPSSAQGPDAM